MATLLAPASASVHLHAARRLHFSSSSDGLIFWLSEECWGRGLVRLGELLEELLIERQAEQPEQPEPPLDPELEAQPLLRAGGNGALSFREEDVDLSRLQEDCRDIESHAFVDAVFAMYQEPYEGMEGSFSCSYTEGLFAISWTPLGDPGTELMQVRALLEEGRNEEAIPWLVQLLEREPGKLEASHVLAMVLSGHRLIS